LVFAAGLGGALTAVLLRPGQGRPWYRVLRLFLAAAAVSLGVWLAALLVDLAAGGAFIRVSTLGAWIASLIVLCSGPGFLVLRAALDLVLWWNALRRRRYLWSLTHLFLLAALSVAFIFMLLGVALVSSTVLTNPQSEAPFLVRLLLQIAPLSLVFFAALVAGLLLILPPSLLVAWWVARGQTRRIEALAGAAAALRAGDLGARVSVSGADELAQLQADFNAMADHLQSSTAALQAERDRVTGLLKAQRELTAGVSHELRTPVTTLGGLLEAALESPSSALPSGLRTDLEVMRAEVQRLQVLIEDLFTLSRAEVNQLSLRCERFDAVPVLAAVAASAAPLAWRAARVTV
ncbi:HAMP domain-containing protein, partial [bacterium]|nr:HAMP domain-containing protein [bacterium]